MPPVSLNLRCVPSHELDALAASSNRFMLGVVGFDAPPRMVDTEWPVTASMTPLLAASHPVCEVFDVTGGADLESGVWHAPPAVIRFRHGNGILFGALTLQESDAVGGAGAEQFSSLTNGVYREIFALLEATRHPHLVRVWNYIPDITGRLEGEERYRLFNTARQAAFRIAGRRIEGSVPAACALGTPTGRPLSIYFLAARCAPRMLENSRQTSAYHYPAQFGSHSPTFSRAALLSEVGGTTLFISGTASIVGFESLHPGDVRAQARETLRNLAAVVEAANRSVGAAGYALEDLRLKVYVRHAADLAAIAAVIHAEARPRHPVVYVQAEVCREELLVEIEASGEAVD